MTLPKFIITMDGYFRLGMVNQHKDLLKPGDSCLGGGYYHFDYASNRIILDRSSYDFGKPKWHLLETLKVPSVYRGLRLVYFYDDDRVFDVSEELNIEYYDLGPSSLNFTFYRRKMCKISHFSTIECDFGY